MTEPCGNERDCDKCYPVTRWKVSKHRIQHLTYTREIKAGTREEAMRIFEAGTARPTQYDDEYGAIVEQDEAVAIELPPSEFNLTSCCWHDLPKSFSDLDVNLTSCDFVGDAGCTDPDCPRCHPRVGA